MKSNTSAPTPRTTKRKPVIIITVTLAVLALVAIFLWSPFSPLRNYAEEVAKPLEQALITSGGVKKCSIGSTGRVPGNAQPNYEARFQLAMNKDDATRLINKVANDNGFTLIHTDSPYESIEWYADTSSKDSNHPSLEAGKVRLAISTHNDTNKKVLTCLDGTALLGDETHTGVSLGITLPPRKP